MTQAKAESQLQRQRASLLRTLLLGLLLFLGLATALGVVFEGRQALAPGELLNNVLIAVSILTGLWLLNRGHLASVVWMVAVVLVLISADYLRHGLAENGIALLLLVLPISLVGLVLGRRSLFLIAAMSLLLVAAFFWLDISGSRFIMQSMPPDPELAATALFFLVIGLLVLFLDRFALTLEASLRRSVQREQELRSEMSKRAQVEARLQLATDSAQVGLWSWDLEEGGIEWSLKMKELFGLPPDATISLDTFFERVHPADEERLRDELSRGQTDNSEPYRVTHPDGSVHWLVGRGQVVTEEERRMMLGAVFEVTQLKEAELERAELLAKEQEARAAAELAGERLAVLANIGHLLAASLDYRETLTRLANLLVPQLADWCAVDVINEDGDLERLVVAHSDPDKMALAYDLGKNYPSDPDSETGAYAVLRSGEPQLVPDVTDDMLQKAARDAHHLEILRSVGLRSGIQAPLVSRGRELGVLTLVHAESGRRFEESDLDLAMQVAERSALAVDNARLFGEARRLNRELEERVAARTRELESANEELEAFTYTVSHDLRAPLRGIGGFSRVLVEDYGEKLDQAARDYLSRIEAGAARMGEMIDDLLELSKVSRAKVRKEPVDLTELANETADELRRRAPERRVRLEVQKGMTIETDPGLIRIALENLLGNAWKYTEKTPEARVTMGRDGGAFFVRDNGAGFDMRQADRIFAPFQRLHGHEEYSGTGIGLATTKRIIERLGGKVWAKGEVGAGATFYFSLPATPVATTARDRT